MDLLTEEQFLNFFANYKGLPGQKKGLLRWRQDMLAVKPGLIGADNEWIKQYRDNPLPEPPKQPATGVMNRVADIPYFRQTNSTIAGRADDMCFSSTMAMFANAFRPGLFKLPHGDDDYLKLLESNGGQSGQAADHVRLLAKLGVKAEFVTDAGWDDLEEQIHKGNPVGVGWYHNGPASKPRRDHGHWSLVVGINATHVLMNDPNGEANLVGGGYLPNLNGEKLLYSRKNWGPRWMAEGANTGWAIIYRGA
jgi:hypothetical protein